MRNVSKARGSVSTYLALSTVLLQFLVAGCASMNLGQVMMTSTGMDIASRTEARGRGIAVAFESELQIARKLEIYQTSDKDSFLVGLATFDNGRFITPYGRYFLSQLSIDLQGRKISNLVLDQSNLVCLQDSWIAPHFICEFSGKISFNLTGNSLSREFKLEKTDIGPAYPQQDIRTHNLKIYLRKQISKIVKFFPENELINNNTH